MREAAEELQLLETLLGGDKRAWDDFVVRYAGVIFAAVRRRLIPAGCVEDAEDVAQDVFVRLCRADFKLLRGYDAERAKLTTWLTVISNSAAIDHLRRRRRPARSIDEVAESELSVDPKEPVRIKIPEGLLSATPGPGDGTAVQTRYDPGGGGRADRYRPSDGTLHAP